MSRLPPLTELRAFEAAARHLSFKAAAAELGVTPTAISHQIKLLEQHCGQPLFRRRPRPLTLTAAGWQLFPVVRDSFQRIGTALDTVQRAEKGGRLRVTATNAFAARWLVPRLRHWRESHPHLRLDVIGTDQVLDLQSGDADVAVRYARVAPADGVSVELVRDTFQVVGSPLLVGRPGGWLTPADLARFPLIETEWLPTDTSAPTWQHWEAVARRRHQTVPRLASLARLNFREELHAIAAVIAGHGLALCSDVLVAPELASGALLRLSDIALPGYGFHIVRRADHLQAALIDTFAEWARQALADLPRG